MLKYDSKGYNSIGYTIDGHPQLYALQTDADIKILWYLHANLLRDYWQESICILPKLERCSYNRWWSSHVIKDIVYRLGSYRGEICDIPEEAALSLLDSPYKQVKLLGSFLVEHWDMLNATHAYALDLHYNNVMCTRSGRLIITDPVVLWYDEL